MTAAQEFSFLWVTDPWETLSHAADTTLRLAGEAAALGIPSFWCDVRSIEWRGGATMLTAQKLVAGTPGHRPELGEPLLAAARDFTSIQYRPDPPVDDAYLHPLRLLLLGGARVTNQPEVLMGSSEKLDSSIADLLPENLVSSNRGSLMDFASHHGRVVLKPLGDAQGRGVALIECQDMPAREAIAELLRAATRDFTTPVMLQKYLSGVTAGEIRMWYVDGCLLAAVTKRPADGSFKIDTDRGGTVIAIDLTPAEARLAELIGRRLVDRGIRLAAVDAIEGFVTDYNFTSPGLLVEMERVTGRNLAGQVIDRLTRPGLRA